MMQEIQSLTKRLRKFQLIHHQPQLLLKEIFLLPPRLQSHKHWTNPFSKLSQLETLRLSRQLRTTSHQFKRTPSREDMLEFFSPLLLNKRLSTPFMRIFHILRDFMMHQTPLSHLLKMQVLARRKWDNSILPLRALELSIH